MRKFIFAFLLVMAMALPVQAADPYNVIIQNTTKKEAMDYIINNLIGQGYSISSANDYQVTVKKDADDFVLQVMYGSNFNRIPEWRTELNFAQMNNNVAIRALVKIVTNPNSAYEKSEPHDNKEIASLLKTCKVVIESQTKDIKEANSLFGFKYSAIPNTTQVLVDFVSAGSLADGELIVGDKITRLNNVPIYDMKNFISIIDHSPKITLTIEREGSEHLVIFERPN